MHNNYDIEPLIISYLTGEASARELLLISDWLREDKNNERVFMQIKEYWNADVSTTVNIDYDKVLSDVTSRIRKYKSKRTLKTTYLRNAGIAAMAACLALFIYMGIGKEAPPVEIYSLISGNSTSQFTLPDGSNIVLNKNSKLTYTSLFDTEKRDVSLEGEAWFEVTKSQEKPFKVELNGTSINVLGTVFTARNVTNEPTTAILLEGSIRFEAPNQSVMLQPNQLLTYNKTSSNISITETNIETAIAWKENLIRYQSSTLGAVMAKLEESYHVTIDIKSDELRNEQVTGAFDANLNLEQILDMVKKSGSFKWKKTEEKRYLIYK